MVSRSTWEGDDENYIFIAIRLRSIPAPLNGHKHQNSLLFVLSWEGSRVQAHIRREGIKADISHLTNRGLPVAQACAVLPAFAGSVFAVVGR